MSNLWDNLRAHFQMADCDADPAITDWAHRYTRNPQRFEDEMSAAMPQLAYVQQIAAAHDVAGEFVFLPWVESQYQATSGRRRRPAGMWQIVPSTARSMDLRMNAHYDGRLDPVASTNAVMSLLRRYYDSLGDWRLVDYAYNTGESSVQRAMGRLGAPADEPAIPRFPVRAGTREHLAKLLALACVVRDPQRFGVVLPKLPKDQHLEVVDIGQPMSLAHAADQAGLTTNTLGRLNAGYLHGAIDADHTRLLLPRANAEQLRAAVGGVADKPPGLLVDDTDMSAMDLLPSSSDSGSSKPKDDARESATGTDSADSDHAGNYVTVGKGDTLWSIARRHGVTVKDLDRWNHLGNRPLRIGQRLRIDSSP